MTDDTRPEPRYEEFDDVHTPEGTAGVISGPAEWNADEEDYEYYVEWEDGQADTQLESFFHDESLEFDSGVI